jgi:hypothetical protein
LFLLHGLLIFVAVVAVSSSSALHAMIASSLRSIGVSLLFDEELSDPNFAFHQVVTLRLFFALQIVVLLFGRKFSDLAFIICSLFVPHNTASLVFLVAALNAVYFVAHLTYAVHAASFFTLVAVLSSLHVCAQSLYAVFLLPRYLYSFLTTASGNNDLTSLHTVAAMILFALYLGKHMLSTLTMIQVAWASWKVVQYERFPSMDRTALEGGALATATASKDGEAAASVSEVDGKKAKKSGKGEKSSSKEKESVPAVTARALPASRDANGMLSPLAVYLTGKERAFADRAVSASSLTRLSLGDALPMQKAQLERILLSLTECTHDAADGVVDLTYAIYALQNSLFSVFGHDAQFFIAAQQIEQQDDAKVWAIPVLGFPQVMASQTLALAGCLPRGSEITLVSLTDLPSFRPAVDLAGKDAKLPNLVLVFYIPMSAVREDWFDFSMGVEKSAAPLLSHVPLDILPKDVAAIVRNSRQSSLSWAIQATSICGLAAASCHVFK